jgi:hypothetical protein
MAKNGKTIRCLNFFGFKGIEFFGIQENYIVNKIHNKNNYSKS